MTMELLYAILFAIAGTAVHVIGKFAEMEKTKRRFDPKKWLKKHKWRTIFGLAGAVLVVFVMYQLGDLTYEAAMMAGYVGDSLAKKGQKEE